MNVFFKNRRDMFCLKVYPVCIAVLLSMFFQANLSRAATADELLVVVNKRMPGAMDIARYYMKRRAIPDNRLVVTSLSLSEVMERDEYDSKLVQPIRNKIAELKGHAAIYGLVLVYGVPLKVLPPAPDWDAEDVIRELKAQEQQLRKDGDKKKENASFAKELNARIQALAGTDKRAAVDSELMLAKVSGYSLANWIENPYFIGFQGKKNSLKKDDVLLVSRLDGPDEATVYRLIDDALAAEEAGLKGKAYFDARWPLPENLTNLDGYALWDASIHRSAEQVAKRMEVRLDAEPSLFSEGAAPAAALYCGWYSLGKYIDSFRWVRGAVGYHIASSECTTLKKDDSEVWCLQMLKHGAAATIGPVYEPYVQAFPLPELFFAALTEGYLNLGESYLVSLPYISWQMVLVGDPLYRPFSHLPPKAE